MGTSLTFLGAAGTVTGSRHLVEHNNKRVLLDCGLFQGLKAIRQRNWDGLGVPAPSLDAVVLSHAHIDHTGFLPRLHRDGFKGPVYCTSATAELLAIMLPDSGRLQEEEANYANKRGSTRHKPALPLYTEEDANRCLRLLKPLPYSKPLDVAKGITCTFSRSGHILGAASVNLSLTMPGGTHSIVFSGDLGRYGMPIIPNPDDLQQTTTLLVECTYGDRPHPPENPRLALRDEVLRTVANKSALIIPSFAIGRTQDLLYHLKQLQVSGEIPRLPIFVDSPMARDATPVYLRHREEHDPEMNRMVLDGEQPLEPATLEFVQTRDASKALNKHEGPIIIIAASGMATGGRVIHHLMQRLPNPNTTVLFVGYQAEGTRGRRLLDGEPTLRMFGNDIPVRARIARIEGFSAHADFSEVDRWLSHVKVPPTRTFCVHGEETALEAMRARLEGRGWNAYVPKHGETVPLLG